jgi:hypothetical protein
MKKTIDSRVFSGIVVVLKWSDDKKANEAGRSWYAVIGGNTHFPAKMDSVTDEVTARAWLNMLCRKQGLLKH